MATSGLTAGKEHIERCAGVLNLLEREKANLRSELAMGEVNLES